MYRPNKQNNEMSYYDKQGLKSIGILFLGQKSEKKLANTLIDLVQKGLLKITIASMAIGVVLVNQSMAMNPAGSNSFFNYTGNGPGGSEEQITEVGLIGAINYYIGLSSKKEYVGFENSLILPDSEINSFSDENIDNYSGDTIIVIINNNSLLASTNFSEPEAEKRREVIVYEVQPGDTPSAIADSFGISTNTMLWANNLDLYSATRIKPGDKLVILPVSGVRHAIKKGETIASISKKYFADKDKILSLNSLKEDDPLEIDSVLIIPDGKISAPPAPAKPKTVLAAVSKNNEDLNNLNNVNVVAGDDRSPSQSRQFPWGQCTYYVALRRYVPWNGHAKYWLPNARAYGYTTGTAPVPGAIIVTAENGRYGHVAYVEAVDGNKVTISEMNFIGVGIKSMRIISASNPIIKGYIYGK